MSKRKTPKIHGDDLGSQERSRESTGRGRSCSCLGSKKFRAFRRCSALCEQHCVQSSDLTRT
jgi:hypothetical protein